MVSNAVAEWLLGAAEDKEAARVSWQQPGGTTYLPCGGRFSAVQIPAGLVWEVLNTRDERHIDHFLRLWFYDGAVILDRDYSWYYCLVPPASEWPTKWAHLDVEYLGPGTEICVPLPTRTEPRGHGYWPVPMASPGALCRAEQVEILVALRNIRLLRKGPAARAAATPTTRP